MSENKYTPLSIVESNYKRQLFSIPLYQRLFEWGNDQIVRLMEDLHHAFRYQSNKPYYIGMLTTIPSRNGLLQLVDGQQRFTVMMLLGITFGWRDFIRVGESPRLKFAARETDNEYLSVLVRIKSCDEERMHRITNIKMNNALEVIDKYIRDKELDKRSFGDFIYSHLTFFISKLEEEYTMIELNTYFERMNTTGKALEPYEILKVTLLSKLKSDKKGEYTRLWNTCSMADQMLYRPTRYNRELSDDEADNNSYERCRWKYQDAVLRILYAKEDAISPILEVVKSISQDLKEEVRGREIIHIKPMDDPLNNNPNNRRRRRKNIFTLLTFPEFLLQVLFITLGYAEDNSKASQDEITTTDFFNEHKLIETFNTYLPQINIEVFFRNLLLYRLLTDYYLVRYSDNDDDPYPFQLYRDFGRKEEIRQFETMLYSASSAMTYYYWVAPLLVWLGKEVKATDSLYINEIAILRKMEALDIIWHPNPFAGEGDVDETLRYGKIDRYYFWRIDYYLWKNQAIFFTDPKQRNLAKDYIFRRNRSIEHIAPQHFGEDKKRFNWYELQKTNPDDAALKDDIGNLCMISSGQNSSLRDSAFEVKRGHIESYLANSISGHIESLKMLYVYGHYPIWTLDNIRAHHQESLSWLEESYNHGLL